MFNAYNANIVIIERLENSTKFKFKFCNNIDHF